MRKIPNPIRILKEGIPQFQLQTEKLMNQQPIIKTLVSQMRINLLNLSQLLTDFHCLIKLANQQLMKIVISTTF